MLLSSIHLLYHVDEMIWCMKYESRSRENPPKMRRKVKFYYFFGFTAIRFRLTDAMHLIQRALESPDLEEHFQYQIQCEKIKKKFLETF